MSETAGLHALGLRDDVLAAAQVHLDAGLRLARVVAEHRESYTVDGGSGRVAGEIAGRFRFTRDRREAFPCVGDWVMVAGDGSAVVIHEVLPRRTFLARKAAGDRTELQPIAANMDVVFVMQGVDRTFNARRLERSVVLVRESDAVPVILLGKADLLDHDRVAELEAEAAPFTRDVRVIVCSSVSGEGLDAIRSFVPTGATGCIIGPSGAGKSRLINTLVGSTVLPTGEVRDIDARGRHTTTLRQLVPLPGGGMLIDTPGMREIGLWHAEAALGDTFPEIGELGADCRFRDCTHLHEPGCAVREAVEEGRLDPGRFESYCKLRHEAEVMDNRTTLAGRIERKRKEKNLSKEITRALKRKDKR
jgi:ribosome biogenesis GTPase